MVFKFNDYIRNIRRKSRKRLCRFISKIRSGEKKRKRKPIFVYPEFDEYSIGLRIVIDYCKTLESLSLSRKHDFTLVLKELFKFLHKHSYVPKDFADNILSVPYNGNSKIPWPCTCSMMGLI